MTDETGKADWRKACNMILSNGLNLELVEDNQEHVQFLIKQGVTKAAARQFIRDIHEWAEHVSCDPSVEGVDNSPEGIVVLSDHSAKAE